MGFFGILQNSKKNIEFSKIPKFQKYLGKFIKVLEFWNFEKLDVFFGILVHSKKTQSFFGILVENP